jgi:hypothetical protein
VAKGNNMTTNTVSTSTPEVPTNPAPVAVAAPSIEEYTALKAEYERLQAKVAESNKHTKQAERQAAEEARKKAEAEGNYQQLFQSSEAERKRLMSDLESMSNKIAQEKVDAEALRVASSLAEGANVELLSEFVKRRLRVTDGCVKVTDMNGNLTVSSLEDLKKEFASNARYAALIAGPKSSGGSATGGSNSGGAAKLMNFSEHQKLSPYEQMKFVLGGGDFIKD